MLIFERQASISGRYSHDLDNNTLLIQSIDLVIDGLVPMTIKDYASPRSTTCDGFRPSKAI